MHFFIKARDGDEREKWVRRLEDTILKHANRNRMQRFYGSSSSHGSHKKQDPLVLFDKKVAEADAYLQLMIEQVAVGLSRDCQINFLGFLLRWFRERDVRPLQGLPNLI